MSESELRASLVDGSIEKVEFPEIYDFLPKKKLIPVYEIVEEKRFTLFGPEMVEVKRNIGFRRFIKENNE